mmetsp:Transcript_45515/g.52563  ORF Transcript_45515/g.52563 Transcript_45515/m.52563 type:complete len:112 (+) Transcript_45515:324-659(+)
MNDNKDKGEEDGENEEKEAEINQDTNGIIGVGIKNKNKNSNNQESYFGEKTEEATNMGANTKTFNSKSGLLQHANRIHLDGDAAARRMEEEEDDTKQGREGSVGGKGDEES